MTVLVGYGFKLAVFGLLVNGRRAASFSELISFLALMSVFIWGMVLISTIFRMVAQRKYKYRIQSQRRF
jgi:hypothetical protein